MQLETLRDFIYLSESLSFSATAKQLYISQPVLSKRISALEKELDVVLFVRDSHSVRLTSEGRLLAKHFREVLDSYDEGIREVERMKRNVNKLLKISYIHGALRDYLPRACQEFCRMNPDTELEMHSLEADQAIIALQHNEVDIALSIFFKNYTPETFERETLFHDNCGVVVPIGHPSADNAWMLPGDLEGETILTPSVKVFPYYAHFVTDILSGPDYRVEQAAEMYDISMVLPILSTGRAIAFVLRHLSGYYGSGFKYIPLYNTPDVDIVALWKKANEKQSVTEFVRCLKLATSSLR
jgi:DNA-binding transcriptional LysR family regulator